MRKILLIGLCALATNFASAESSVNKESTPATSKAEVVEFVVNESVMTKVEIIPEISSGMITFKCRDGYTTTIFMFLTGNEFQKEEQIRKKAIEICKYHGGCQYTNVPGYGTITQDPIIRP